MTEAATRERLNELMDMIVSFAASSTGRSNGAFDPPFAQGGESVEAVINALRVQIKYLLFDLEATRRENRYLRQMLENRSSDSGGRNGEGSGPY